MNQDKQCKSAVVRPPHKPAKQVPLHLEVSRPEHDPRAGTDGTAPVVYPLRLPPRAKSYSKSELATAAKMFTLLKRGDDFRQELVTDIRQALVHENYDSAMKVETAVERLLADLRLAELN